MARGQTYASLIWEDKKNVLFFATCLGKSTPGPAPFSSVKLGAFADSPSRAKSPSFSVLAFTRVERARACWLPTSRTLFRPKNTCKFLTGSLLFLQGSSTNLQQLVPPAIQVKQLLHPKQPTSAEWSPEDKSFKHSNIQTLLFFCLFVCSVLMKFPFKAAGVCRGN